MEELVSRASSSSDPFPAALASQSRSTLLDRALGMMGFTAASVSDSDFHARSGVALQFYPQAAAFSIQALESILVTAAFHGDARPGCAGSLFPEADSCQGKNVDDNLAPSQRVEFGSAISLESLQELMEICKFFVTSGQGDEILSLVETVLKVAIDIPCCKAMTPSSYEKNPTPSTSSEKTIEFLDVLRRGNLYGKLSSSSRINAWQLDPKQLKRDVSDVLATAVEQPDLDLEENLFLRREWKILVLALAASPQMFLEVDCLLQKWSSLSSLGRVDDIHRQILSAAEKTQAMG